MTSPPRPKADPILRLFSLRPENEGFTLIELLVVIIIIGVLSAIALPSFLNQANKARESEGKQYIGSMNRAQQAHFLEYQRFTSDVTRLGLGISTATSNYSYSVQTFSATDTLDLNAAPDETAAANIGLYQAAIANIAYATNTNTLRSLIGAVDVMLSQGGARSEGDGTVAIICQSETPSAPKTDAVLVDVSTVNTERVDCSESAGFVSLE